MTYGSDTSSRLIDKLRTDVDGLLLRNAIVEHQEPSGTDGGTALTTITADSTLWTADAMWVTADATNSGFAPRKLNIIAHEADSTIKSLNGNVVTLVPGTYKLKGVFTFNHTDHTRLEIFNVTQNRSEAYGLNGDFKNTVSGVVDVNVIVSHKKDTGYMVRYRCSRSQTIDGLGIASGFGVPECYGSLEITRLDQLKPEKSP